MANNPPPKVDLNEFKSEIKYLQRQRFLGRIIFYPLALIVTFVLRVIFRYKIKNTRKIRKKYRQLVKENSPLLLCSNHLTLIDSLIIHLGMARMSWYFLNYKHFNWNTPAVENFTKKLYWRFLLYFGKCIPIDRFGSPEHHDMVLDKIKYLLRDGEICTIFPEGGRSRSALIDIENTTYGIGRIVQDVENCKVLCVYLRGEGQDKYSDYPENGEKFYIDMEVIKPESMNTGMRQARDISLQVMYKLKEMEDKYFQIEKN
ncbi:MAG: 1-acyl-sn-glycerol-3-phosphate acyltransferase [Spirochaetia bacterium]|nr:1-acyl-sn-glycerol-3-phosphate acyltransferase [Spirochaetia bacterium]